MCPPWGGTTKIVLAFAEKASVGKAGEKVFYLQIVMINTYFLLGQRDHL